MKNSSMKSDQLFGTNPASAAYEQSICKLDISGYLLDNYKIGNLEDYTILCRVSQASDGLSYFPKSSKIVLNTTQPSKFIKNYNQIVPNIANDLGIPQQAARKKYINFFSNKQVTIQPTGLQGKVYRILNSAQNFVPMAYTTEALSILKTTGMSGFSIITKAPLTFVGATYIGSIFFGYCACIAGENSVGIVLNGASFVLSRPMRGVEITLNGLILRPVSNVIGLPLILNGTSEILHGKGLSIQEYTKIGIAFERIANSTLVEKGKKIYRIFRDKG